MVRFFVVSTLLSGLLSASALADHGYEIALDGTALGVPGRSVTLSGVVYRVDGIAELSALRARAGQPEPRVRARYESLREDIAPGPWVVVDPHHRAQPGGFVVSIPVPRSAAGESLLVFELDARRIEIPLALEEGESLEFRADRRFYQAGEVIHLWSLAREEGTGRPLAGREVPFRLEGMGPQRDETATTDDSGVAHVTFPIPAEARSGSLQASSWLGSDAYRLALEVGQRSRESLLVDVDVGDDPVPPGASFEAKVRVRSASGAAVGGARVTVTVGGLEPVQGTTGRDGYARVRVRAPAFLRDETGGVSLAVEAAHRAHGRADAHTFVVLAIPQTLGISAVAGHGGLLADQPSPLYVTVLDATGTPPAPLEVTVRGPGFARGEMRVTSDVHGLVRVDPRVATIDAARYGSAAGCEGRLAVSYEISVEGPAASTTRVCVPLLEDVEVRPEVQSPVAAPGETVEVRLTRRGRAEPTLVMLVAEDGQVERSQISMERTVRFEAPPTLGFMRVIARTLSGPGSDVETAFGVGAADGFLVRPAAPSFIRAEPTQDIFQVRGTASVAVHTRPGAPRGWIAVDVRDLAQHGGEVPFRLDFLRAGFRRALLDPDTVELDRLLRATLAHRLSETYRPPVAAPLIARRGVEVSYETAPPLRDPVRAAREHVRRGLGEAFRHLESRLKAGDEITTGEGARREFAADALVGSGVETLDGRATTPAELEASDPSFSFEAAARRVARERLWKVLSGLIQYSRPEDEGGAGTQEPPARWISTLVQAGALDAQDIRDPWGGAIGWRTRPAGVPPLSGATLDETPAFPGPDGRLGTADDIVDPLARVVPEGTPYALASGEDDLMARIAILAPGGEALQAMLEEFSRMTQAMRDAERGDIAGASATLGIGESFGFGGLGLRGTGRGGGGSGSGHGYGRGRSSRSPSIRMGNVGTVGHGGGSLLDVVREDFPGTLHFIPSLPLDASGQTEVTFDLADAATTYLVEVVHWREDGWTWSTSTRVRVEQPLVVDAPVPRYATEGDVLVLPVRAQNRSGSPLTVTLAVEGEGLSVPRIDIHGGTIPPSEALAREATLTLHAGEGALIVRADAGSVTDATRRRLRVFEPGRRVDDRRDGLLRLDSESPLSIDVPAEATGIEGLRIEVSTGRALFGSGGRDWSAWAEVSMNRRAAESEHDDALSRLDAPRTGEDIARALAIAWRDPRLSDRTARTALEACTNIQGEDERSDETRAMTLLMLAPVLRHSDARPELRPLVDRVGETLARVVGRRAVARVDAPGLHALAAAALAAGFPESERRARELLRRARRSMVRFGDARWIQARLDNSQNALASAAFGLAAALTGEYDEAFALLATLSERAVAAGAPIPRARPLAAHEAGLARALAAVLGGSPADSVDLLVDGRTHHVSLSAGVGTLTLDAPTTGHHDIALSDVAGETGALSRVAAHVSAEVRYRMPWAQTPRGTVPLQVSVEAEETTGPTLDGRRTYWLEVHNLRPRTLRGVEVTVTLPAGAELDDEAIDAIEARSIGAPTRDDGNLVLRLATVFPARRIRIPIHLRFGVAGRLHGLGVVARPLERPDRVTVVPPTILEVSR